MRKLISAVLLGATLGSSTGCFIPGYSGDPLRRSQELLNTSENLRLLNEEWERLWMLDQPSHLTPYHTHGGII
jgi:hypothetical protein